MDRPGQMWVDTLVVVAVVEGVAAVVGAAEVMSEVDMVVVVLSWEVAHAPSCFVVECGQHCVFLEAKHGERCCLQLHTKKHLRDFNRNSENFQYAT